MKLIKNAKIINDDTGDLVLKNIYFNRFIKKITPLDHNEHCEETIDLEGKLLIPGCIDAHVHFNDPGFTHHETFFSGTSAAAAGGITTIIDMPCTSIPAVTNKENLLNKVKIISPKAVVDFALWGGIRKEDFPYDQGYIEELWNEGVVGFKIYTISGMEDFKALSYEQIDHVFHKFPQMLFAFHAEDQQIIETNLRSLTEKDLFTWHKFSYIRSAPAEYTAVKNIIDLIQKNKVHIVHVSSRMASEIIINAKKNLDITFETCPHYLQFTSGDFAHLRGKLKTTPPVKFSDDKKFLRTSLKNGTIDFVATDHAGCDFKLEKELDDFSAVYSGIPGVQLMVPYLFSEFYLKEEVSLRTMIQITSENQAKRYGLYPSKGSLMIGTDADFTIIDLNKDHIVNENELLSLGKYSPFHNETFNCSIDKTIVRGNVVYDSKEGVQAEQGYGNWIKRT